MYDILLNDVVVNTDANTQCGLQALRTEAAFKTACTTSICADWATMQDVVCKIHRMQNNYRVSY